ncbi:MAG: hypothetical protein DU429_00300 [Candidatus Tokpelaia sp.]|nr:MAG: hypothetical protein DU430_09220 [Candidatus Tokpelaia sp.]KAA6207550.1 MAG: hypothetical protein DU429_00300 [Candidatus Tokpelaia sp.]
MRPIAGNRALRFAECAGEGVFIALGAGAVLAAAGGILLRLLRLCRSIVFAKGQAARRDGYKF